MTATWEIAAAEPPAAAGIVETIREGFEPALLQLFIYGCQGVERFVAQQIAVQEQGGDTHYTVARDAHRVLGCVELRRIQEGLFLNYVAIRRDCRAQGLAARLLHRAIELAGQPTCQTLTLDVLEGNQLARDWYARLGFRERSWTAWFRLPLGLDTPAPVSIQGFAQAQACQQVYGFSRFQVASAGRAHDVGRLGTEWFRLTSRDALRAPGLRAALRGLDPERQILLLDERGDVPAEAIAQPVARTRRLSLDLASLVQRLQARVQPGARSRTC